MFLVGGLVAFPVGFYKHGTAAPAMPCAPVVGADKGSGGVDASVMAVPRPEMHCSVPPRQPVQIEVTQFRVGVPDIAGWSFRVICLTSRNSSARLWRTMLVKCLSLTGFTLSGIRLRSHDCLLCVKYRLVGRPQVIPPQLLDSI